LPSKFILADIYPKLDAERRLKLQQIRAQLMQIDLKTVAASPVQTLSWLVLFVLAKPVLTFVATRAVGYDRMNAGRAEQIDPARP
jgi:hypothetical protein